MSTQWPYAEFNGRLDHDRDRKNISNVALYFSLTAEGQRILHIGAGDNPYPGSLAEYVEQFSDTRYPQLLAVVGDPIDQYLPPGEMFDKVIVVNVRNYGRSADYGWVFRMATTVMSPGAMIVVAAFNSRQPSIRWAIAHEQPIGSLGFTKVSPITFGQFEAATSDIKALPGSAWQFGAGMVSFSNASAVQVMWMKN
jgi:hypothetical protein